MTAPVLLVIFLFSHDFFIISDIVPRYVVSVIEKQKYISVVVVPVSSSRSSSSSSSSGS